MLIPKRVSWLFLVVFIIFDNIFSYFAIVYHGMRELGIISRFLVEITPLYYFISIPLTIIFIYFLIKITGIIEEKTDKSGKFKKEINEKLMLGSLMIAWGIGITLFNFITFLRDFSTAGMRYEIFLITGILTGVFYGIYASWLIKKGKIKREL